MNTVDKGLLVVLFLAYGLLSMPIPQGLGIGELVVGALVFVLVFRNVHISFSDTSTPNVVSVLSLVWLLIVPVIVGLFVMGVDTDPFVRDFIPFLFLTVPFLLSGVVRRDPEEWANWLGVCFSLSGFALAARYIYESGSGAFDEVSAFASAPINQCPTVIFAAVYGFLCSVSEKYKLLPKLLFFVCALLCLTTLMMAVMRAQIVLVVLAVAVVLVSSGRKRPLLYAVFFGAVLLAYLVLSNSGVIDAVMWTLEMATRKTESAGLLNARDGEAEQIFKVLFGSVDGFLVGSGWGASMYLPTAGGTVRFAHNGSLFYLWKTGVLGTLALYCYVFSVIRPLPAKLLEVRSRSFQAYAGIAAAGSAVLIFGFIEMGYKMMSFGFVLLALVALFEISGSKKVHG